MFILRISTSPPNDHEVSVKQEYSFYCNLYKLEDWKDIDILTTNSNIKAFIDSRNVASAMIVAQHQFDDRYKEVGLLLEFRDDEGQTMYFGIDHAGIGRAEPAVNEAAWHIANSGQTLADNHRLKRISSNG